MNFQLLWIDALLASLLWVAASAACVARTKRKWIRIALFPVVFGPPLFVFGIFTFAAAMMKFEGKIEPSWFGYSLSLLLAYLVATPLLFRLVKRRPRALPAGPATWPRGPLIFAFLTTVAVGYMTLCNMDLAIRARCVILSVKINSIYLAASPAITSDSQNAAFLYERAFARLRDDPPTDVNNPPTGRNDIFDPNEPATLAFLKRHAATILLLRRAAALPACRFDQDLADPNITLMLPVLNDERGAANVLRLDANEQLARGDASSAILDAAAILGMSRQFGQRPLLISALVAMGIDAVGNKTLQDALAAVKNPNELAALHLDDLPSAGRTLQQALRGEESFGLFGLGSLPRQMDFTNGAANENTNLVASSAGGPPAIFFRVFFLDLDAYIELMQNLQNLAVQPYYKIRDQLPDAPGRHSSGLFTSILAPSLSRAFEQVAKVEARDACAQTAVAMTRFKLDHGKYPAQLADLTPTYLETIPLDPFDGHPIKLTITGDQCILYSASLERIDFVLK